MVLVLASTGFIKGGTISQNFVYATELVQCCHKRKAPTLVLKLDFAKLFDSVCWDSLLVVLHIRDFPDDAWCSWIQQPQETTAKSAVMLNGVPGAGYPVAEVFDKGIPITIHVYSCGRCASAVFDT
jgi:hypothetical protein